MADPPAVDSALTAMMKASGKPKASAGNGPVVAQQEAVAIMDDVERLCRHLAGIGQEVEDIGRIYRAECADLAVAFRDRTEALIAKLIRLQR